MFLHIFIQPHFLLQACKDFAHVDDGLFDRFTFICEQDHTPTDFDRYGSEINDDTDDGNADMRTETPFLRWMKEKLHGILDAHQHPRVYVLTKEARAEINQFVSTYNDQYSVTVQKARKAPLGSLQDINELLLTNTKASLWIHRESIREHLSRYGLAAEKTPEIPKEVPLRTLSVAIENFKRHEAIKKTFYEVQ